MITCTVYAKATEKLSAELVAVKISGGTLIGVSADSGAVVEAAHATLAIAVTEMTKAGATRINETVPAKIMTHRGLIVVYRTQGSLSDAFMANLGLRVIDRHDVEDIGHLLVEPLHSITAIIVSALDENSSIIHVEINQAVTTSIL